jgi:DNA ligase-1
MKKEFAMLAHTYNEANNPVGWFASRKLNGWGCVWDGGVTTGMRATDVPWYYQGGDDKLTHEVYSTGLWTIGRADKNGMRPKVIHAPDWFVEALPKNVPLQGELWRDDDLSLVKSVCGCSNPDSKLDPRWATIDYLVYNSKPYCLFPWLATENRWSNRVYTDRMYTVEKAYKPNDVWGILNQTRVESREHFKSIVDEANSQGWEGIMLVNPLSYYEDYRSHNLLKVKPVFETEARIVGYEQGKTGKNIGKLGALWAELTWDEKVLSYTGGSKAFVGTTARFKISGMTDKEREFDFARAKWPIGCMAHFKFSCISTHGVPMSCNILEGE